MRRYVVTDINPLLADITRRWSTALELRGQLRRVYQRLEEAGHTPGQNPPAGASREVRRDHAVVLALRDTLRAELTAIGDTGCVIRDLDSGLCDWPGVHAGRDVWLCWRVGEPEVAWFHEAEAGFAGRRPISELIPVPAPRARARR